MTKEEETGSSSRVMSDGEAPSRETRKSLAERSTLREELLVTKSGSEKRRVRRSSLSKKAVVSIRGRAQEHSPVVSAEGEST